MEAVLKIEFWIKWRKHLFLMLLLAIFILSILYLYFLNLSALKTVERKNNLAEMSQIKKEVQSLEASYLDIVQGLDLNRAKELGFVEASPNKFVYRQKVVAQAINHGEVFR